jgi:spermidine/putrescine-binding protein
MEQPLTPPRGVITRRTFLGHAGALGFAVAAGGAFADTALGARNADASAASVGGDFNIFTWAGYEGSTPLKSWYKKEGIKLNAKAISNEDIAAVIKGPGGSKWDASSVNQGDADYYLKVGVSSQITVKEVPALAKMMPFFRDSSLFRVSPGVYNSVPWTWGPIGISYRPDKVPAAKLNSWWNLTKPEFKGRLGTFDSGLNMVAIGAVAAGLDPGKLTSAQLNGPVKQYLAKLRPNLKVLSTSLGDQVNTLVSGDVDVQLVGLNWFAIEGKKQKTTIGFITPPKEGSFGFVDAVFIPPKSAHRDNALAYANALMQGPTAVAMQNSVNQLSSNPAVNAMVQASTRALYPKNLVTYTSKTLKWNKSYYDPKGKFATIQEWNRLWEQVKAG